MLTDNFGRIHNYLRVSLTERCNLRCTYCMPEDGVPLRKKSCFMSGEEVVSLIQVFSGLGVKKVRFTGGEPLIRKDFHFILKETSRLPLTLALTTNGVLLDKFIPILQESGLRDINVSLDSLRPERFTKITRRCLFDKVKDNISLCIDNGFNIKLNIVLINGFNEDEVLDFVNLTKNLPLAVRFIEFMPFNGNS